MSLSITSQPSANLIWLSQRDRALQLTLARLASGQRITKAADDPAGLVISEQMRALSDGMDQASANTEEGISMAQTADGGLEQSQSILNQQRAIALQAANSALMDPNQLAALNAQFNNLSQSLDRVAGSTTFAGKPLLDGSYRNQSLQIGPSSGDTVQVDIASRVTGQPAGFDSRGLGLAGIDLSNPDDALARIDAASSAVGQQRGDIGALQANVLQTNADSLAVAHENLVSAQSGIADTDYAQQASELVRNQILFKAGIAMQAQGNQLAGRVLQLLS